MKSNFTTNRLSLTKITLNDSEFILELVNTEEWIKFIGNRNIKDLVDARRYIQKILINENTQYWVVKLKDAEIAIGVITLLKRDYLDNQDIGFAFLDQYKNQGYAFEAASKIIKQALKEFKTISAITLPHNTASIKLIEKLNFKYHQELRIENEHLLHYQIEN